MFAQTEFIQQGFYLFSDWLGIYYGMGTAFCPCLANGYIVRRDSLFFRAGRGGYFLCVFRFHKTGYGRWVFPIASPHLLSIACFYSQISNMLIFAATVSDIFTNASV